MTIRFSKKDSSVGGGITFKGDYDAATNTPDLDVSPSGILTGDMYVVSVAGTFFTEAVQIEDSLIAKKDNPTLLSDWVRLDGNAQGDMLKSVYDPTTISGDAFTMNNMVEGATTKIFTDTERIKLIGIQANATIDQTDLEIETAYNNQVSAVSQIDAEAGISTIVNRWTPERVKQAIKSLATFGYILIDPMVDDLKTVIESASASDSFLLLPGIHNVSASITIPTTDITIQGIGYSSVVNWLGASTSSIFIVNTDFVKFKSFKIKNSPANAIKGIEILDGDDILVDDCLIEVTGVGVDLERCARAWVKNCFLKTGQSGVVATAFVDDASIESNLFVDCGSESVGINSTNLPRPKTKNNRVINTRVNSTEWTRIRLNLGSNIGFIAGDIITQAVTGATAKIVDVVSTTQIMVLRTNSINFDLINNVTGNLGGSSIPVSNIPNGTGIRITLGGFSITNSTIAEISGNYVVSSNGICISTGGDGANIIGNIVAGEIDCIRVGGNISNVVGNHVFRQGGRGIHLFNSNSNNCVGNTVVTTGSGDNQAAIDVSGKDCLVNGNRLISIISITVTLVSGSLPSSGVIYSSSGVRATVIHKTGTVLEIIDVEGRFSVGDTLRTSSATFEGTISSVGSVQSFILVKNQNNTISNNFIDMSSAPGKSGILCDSLNVGGHIIHGNTIMGQETAGIKIDGGSNIKVSGNKIKYCGDEGIKVAPGLRGISLKDNDVLNSSLSSPGTFDAISALAGCDLMTLQLNRIASSRQTLTVVSGIGFLLGEGVTQGNAEGSIIAISVNDITIQWFNDSEVIVGANLVGITSAVSSNVTAIVNIGTYKVGISVVDSSYLVINENIFYNSKNQGLLVDGITDTLINDNQFLVCGLESIELLNACSKIGMDGNIIGQNVSGDNLTISNLSADIKLDDNILTGTYNLGTSGSLFPRANLGIQNIVNWTPISPTKFTATPVSTLQIAMSDTSDIKQDMAIRYRTLAGTFYGRVASFVANTSFNILGPAFVVLEDILQLDWGIDVKAEVRLTIPGNWATIINPNLVAGTGFPFPWTNEDAFLIGFGASQHIVDSGVEGKLNLEVNNLAVSINDTNKGIQLGLVDTFIGNPDSAINPTNYGITKGDLIEASCTAVGGVKDGEDLTIIAFVTKKGI